VEVKRSRSELEPLLLHCQTFEPERLQLLVYFAQLLGDQFGYEFDIHHFKVFSEDLATDISRLRNENCCSSQRPSELVAFVTNTIGSVRLEQLDLAAANMYFENKGYAATEIEGVLNPDKQLLKGAVDVISDLKSFKPKSLAASGSR
jgi:hypothetical protein